jgi:UDP-N-acetylglucosamine--N-acetylmuramyl-(pentapeptide) pyrophosphoryl-undecaprenol N-acetylglucosamine transferase
MVRHRILLTGGGTGGHIYPALAVADYLRDDADVEDLLYIGASGHLEEKLASDRQLKFVGLSVSGMPRKVSPALISWAGRLSRSIVAARRIIANFQPTIVLGTGGYASAPPLVAALMMSVPYAIHEPDAHPGLVNRTLAPWAQLVSLGMDGALSKIKTSRGRVVVNGNPVEKKFFSGLRRDAACAVLGLDSNLKTILITGGSQGAKAINDAINGALPQLLALDPPVQIIHQVGQKNYQEFKDNLPAEVAANSRYMLRAYFDDLSTVYAATDLAICRAGAMTIAELSVCGCPALFIPAPQVTADHQTSNARFVATQGAARLLAQKDLTAEALYQQVQTLIADGDGLNAMKEKMLLLGKPRAASDLANQLKEVSTAFQVKSAAGRS